MDYVIEWTFHAQEELNAVYDYLEANWTSREIIRFTQLLERKLLNIAYFPFIYPASKQKYNIHRCVVSKQSSMYYQVNEKKKQIVILSFFDNRRNPAGLHY